MKIFSMRITSDILCFMNIHHIIIIMNIYITNDIYIFVYYAFFESIQNSTKL